LTWPAGAASLAAVSTQHASLKPPPIPWSIWKIAAVTGAGSFIVMLDSTVVNLALESIRQDFDARLTLIQWVASGYLVALAVSLPASAWLGSRFGYGTVYQWALAGFTFGSALCAIAPDPVSLIAARVVQGLAGGLMVPSAHAVNGSVTTRRQLGRVIGTLGIMIAIGPALGPVAGGWILEVSSWRWLFWINVPVGIFAFWGGQLVMPRGAVAGGRTLDRRGLLMVGIGLPLLLYGLTEIGSEGVSAISLFAAVAGGLLLPAFALTAHRAVHPLLDLKLLKRKVFGAGVLTAGLSGANMYGGLLLLPLYFQVISGRTIAETGLLLLWLGLGSGIALPIAGQLIDRFGAGLVCVSGAVALVVSTVPFVFMDDIGNTLLTADLLLRGAGLALVQMPAMTAAYTSVTGPEMGDAASLINIVQRTGGAIGAVGIVVILAQLGNGRAAYHGAFMAILVASACALALASYLHRHIRLQEAARREEEGVEA
jgi:EmrB/QacA subfamily drug resistance transporter